MSPWLFNMFMNRMVSQYWWGRYNVGTYETDGKCGAEQKKELQDEPFYCLRMTQSYLPLLEKSSNILLRNFLTLWPTCAFKLFCYFCSPDGRAQPMHVFIVAPLEMRRWRLRKCWDSPEWWSIETGGKVLLFVCGYCCSRSYGDRCKPSRGEGTKVLVTLKEGVEKKRGLWIGNKTIWECMRRFVWLMGGH